MIVIGIDPSLTSTGIIVLRNGEIEIAETTKNRPELGAIDRVYRIRHRINEVLTQIRHPKYDLIPQAPDLIVIEGFSYGSKGRGLFQTAYLGYRIREELEGYRERDGIPWLEVSPSQLKQFATGKGNSPKEIVLQQVYKRWGAELKDNNQADAYVLAAIGQSYLGYNMDLLTEFQQEVISALKGEVPPKKTKKKVKTK